jgi:seryl-tRNA synthetase
MLIPAHVREHFDQVVARLQKRNIDAAPQLKVLLSLDEERRATQATLDKTLAQANTIAKEIGQLFKQGAGEEATAKKQESAALKASSKELQDKLQDISKQLQEVLYQLPNIPHPSVPSGNSDEDNEEVFQKGSIPALDDNALPHWELAKKYKLIDFELGAKITGAGFPVYTGKGAKLQRALINYFLDFNTAAGYGEVQVPHLVNEASGLGTGQLPDKEGQMYHVTEDDLYLIPTAEVPVTNLYRDSLIQEDELPIKLTAYTPCFRREAGSYGAHVRGLNRLHQFDKVEVVRISHPEQSYAALDEMVDHVGKLLSSLDLPYRILRLCGGDLGFTAALTYDFEVFSTAQNRWLEVSSVSNFESFQANRLKLRYKGKDGKKQLAHTLNGSALALPRIVAGLLENHQKADGIHIPKALVPYTGFDIIN